MTQGKWRLKKKTTAGDSPYGQEALPIKITFLRKANSREKQYDASDQILHEDKQNVLLIVTSCRIQANEGTVPVIKGKAWGFL
eukprot:12712539-Ditylum_brightwellii.AAC.1